MFRHTLSIQKIIERTKIGVVGVHFETNERVFVACAQLNIPESKRAYLGQLTVLRTCRLIIFLKSILHDEPPPSQANLSSFPSNVIPVHRKIVFGEIHATLKISGTESPGLLRTLVGVRFEV